MTFAFTVLGVCLLLSIAANILAIGCCGPQPTATVLTGLVNKLNNIMATQQEMVEQLRAVKAEQDLALATLQKISTETDGLLAKIEQLLQSMQEAAPDLISVVEEIKTGIAAINSAALNVDAKVPDATAPDAT